MTPETWGIILIVYGIVCAYIVLTKPNFIYQSAKFKVMMKMMGEKGFNIFLIVWTLAALIAGILLYTL
jgi:hypothetical protein